MAQPQTYRTTPDNDNDAPDTVDLTREEGRQVAEDARQQAGEVAGSVKAQATGVANEAMGHAKDLAADAKQQLHTQARQQTDALGGALGSLGGRVQALADGNVEEAGPIGDYARRLASQVDRAAGKVDELGFDGMLGEVQRYARRKPGAFLLGAAATGFAVSRLARGGQSADSSQPTRSARISGPQAHRDAGSPGERDLGAPSTRAVPTDAPDTGTAPMPGLAGDTPSTATGMTGGAAVGTPPPPPMPRSADPAPGAAGSPLETDDFGRTGR